VLYYTTFLPAYACVSDFNFIFFLMSVNAVVLDHT
jgi:hypothetical protein